MTLIISISWIEIYSIHTIPIFTILEKELTKARWAKISRILRSFLLSLKPVAKFGWFLLWMIVISPCNGYIENWKGKKNHDLSMKEGSLFCFVIMRSTERWCFRSCSWCLWKALDEEGCMGLILWCLDLRCKSSWILNDFFIGN